jgi:hypothetical protein
MSDPVRPPEAEIIPPGEPLRHRSGRWEAEGAGVYRVRTVKLGPGGIALLVLGLGAAATVGFFVLLGAALISLAAIGLVTVGAVIAALLRGPGQRLR